MTIPELTPLPFEVDGGFGERARLGLIVLESDQTLEVEARSVDLPGVSFYHSRIRNESDVTPSTLTAMEERLPAAAALLSPEFGFDAIGYGCTSAATLIGDERVTAAIRSAHPGIACTNPIAAAIAAFYALEARRVAVVTPYTEDVTMPIAERFADAGLEVTALGSFLEPSDLVVARIAPASVAAAIRSVVDQVECDAVFVSCTSLRVMEIADDVEAEIGRPVVSSNVALLWHLLRLGGVVDPIPGFGRLFTTTLDPRFEASMPVQP